MKRCGYILLAFMTMSVSIAHGQTGNTERNTVNYRGGRSAGYELIDGDTVQMCTILPVYVFRKPKDMRQYQKLVNNVKKVYPIAKQARAYLDSLELQLSHVKGKKAQDKLTKEMEKKIVKRYTPVLEKMTYSQGKVLIKLIDRETDRTSYELLRDFRGKFSASFWNTIARIFKANLKQGYDKDDNTEDQLIEQIIILYEAGLL